MKKFEVDIIIPVHNSWDLVKECISSVLETREASIHRVHVVDDGSLPVIARELMEFSAKNLNFDITRVEKAGGFTKSANIGLRKSFAPMVVILNSDTIVSAGWIHKLQRALFSNTGVGIVGPLSNAASYQSIPRTSSNAIEVEAGQTAINALPAGLTLKEVNDHLEQNLVSVKFRVPMIHGFCLVIRREVIDQIGMFDEESFPSGYGEEDDYCIRAVDAGWSLLWATDTYVYHHKSGSYDPKRRRVLVSEGSAQLLRKHGQLRVKNNLNSLAVSASALHDLLPDSLRSE